MLLIILLLLVVGAIIAVFAYERYNNPENALPPIEEQAPPLSP